MNTKEEDWIQVIHRILEESRHVPQWGNIPALDFKKLSSSLAHSLSIPMLQIEPGAPSWIDAERIKKVIKQNKATVLKLSHLPGQILWLITEEEQKLLCYHMLVHGGIKGAVSPSFQQGFYKYLLLEAIHHFEMAHMLTDLHLKISDEPPFDENYCLYPLTIKIQEMELTSHIALSSSIQKSLRHHFKNTPKDIKTSPLSKDLELMIKLQVGRTSLTLKEWRSLRVGDFVLLDHCSYDPSAQKGSVTLVLENTPILRAKLKKNSIKIQDFAFYHEEEKPMTDHDTQFEDSFSSDDLSKENMGEDLSDVESLFSDEETEKGEHMWSGTSSDTSSIDKIITTEEIPLTLTVEVDRLRMTLSKLLELSPGNVLELSVRPEQGVSITVGGKKVAHGELVKIGDVLGLKILQIAK